MHFLVKKSHIKKNNSKTVQQGIKKQKRAHEISQTPSLWSNSFCFNSAYCSLFSLKHPGLSRGIILQFLNPFFRLTHKHWVQKIFFATEINEILRMYQECTRAFNFENGKLNTMIEQLFTCKWTLFYKRKVWYVLSSVLLTEQA